MVYSNKFVICVLVNGQPQKELANGAVSLPFGTEYALRLRNKNNRRSVAKIYIDGENVSGGGYVVNGHNYVDIKRHHDIDRALKFVSLDSPDAVDHGKNGPNHDKVKGTIEVRFYLEKEAPQVIYRDVHHDHHHHHHNEHWIESPKPQPRPPWRPYPDVTWTTNHSDLLRSGGESMKYTCNAGGAGASSLGARSVCPPDMTYTSAPIVPASFENMSSDKNLQDGCTVEGYSTGQNFYSTSVETEDEATVLKIFLQGFEHEEVICQARPTNKGVRLNELESENDTLRRKIAEMENEKLKQQLESLK